METLLIGNAMDTQMLTGCRLWIDGVGCWLIWFRPELSIGNVAPNQDQKWPIQADLRTVHATIRRDNGEYTIEAMGRTLVDSRPVDERTFLAPKDQITLGQDVEFEFDVPSPLSDSATLKLNSGHRTGNHAEGIVLMHESCLLGNGRSMHINCRGWKQPVVLFRRDGQLWWKEHGASARGEPVADGDHLAGSDWSFRIEAVS